MFPPETMATMGPWPALPVRAAAKASAPAPSAMTRTFSAMRRIARFTSSSVTTIEPSTTGRMRCHMRGNTLLPPAPSTNVACHSGNSSAVPLANERAAGAAVSGSATPKRTSGLRPLPPRGPPAPADRRDDGRRVGRVLENLEPHGRVTGDEILIVERMHERSLDSRIRPVVERLPCARVGNQHELGAERAHAVELGLRRGLDRDDGARHARGPCGIRDALSRIPRADRPDAAAALGIGQ